MRLPLATLALAASLLLGCTQTPSGDAGTAAAPLAASPALPTSEVPPPGQPEGVAPVDVPPAQEPGGGIQPDASLPRTGAAEEAGDRIDYSCSTDADCAVKDVGNCCGYYPACVNADSPTFPEQVKARCQKEGMSSICGFPAIESCVCKAGRCEAGPTALPVE